MKIPKALIKPIMVASIEIGILSASVPMVSYAAEPELVVETNQEINPVTEDIVYEVYGEHGGGKASMDEQYLQDLCNKVAKEYENIEGSVLHALCLQESRGRDNINDIYTSASALGITQIEPSAHQEEIKRLGYSDSDVRNDPEAAITVSAEILSERIEARGGDLYKALIDYNMGHNKADKKFEENPNYKWSYADNVLKVANMLSSEMEREYAYEL